MLKESEIKDLEDFEAEMIKAVSHDLLDLIPEDALEKPLIEESGTQEDVDEALDSACPLNDSPVCDVRTARSKVPATVYFNETLSLYARVFRAAEHILDAGATMTHFSRVLDLYLNSVAYGVRVFDKKLRPIALRGMLEQIEYERMNDSEKKLARDQINAFINFAIAAIPNWSVAMMNSDFFNQRQRPRIEKYRKATKANLRKILLTYSLCELEEVDVVAEVKSQKFTLPHECSSVLMKTIELIMFNFSISGEEKKELEKFARKVLSDRRTNNMLKNLNVISKKMSGDGGEIRLH